MTTVSPAFDLPGDWTSPRLLLRLLMVIDAPWEPRQNGFTHRETGERVKLVMGPPTPGLAQAMALGVDPVCPSIDGPLLDAITEHKAVVSVVSEEDATRDAVARALTLLNATTAIVNAGALAVRCRTSGLSHGADAFLALAAAVADDQVAGLLSTFVWYDLQADRPRTIGLHAFGFPDVVLATPMGVDHAYANLEAAARLQLQQKAGAAKPVPDSTSVGDMRNPFGLVIL